MPASPYISTESLTPEELVRVWDQIALTSQEDLVLRALRFVDPKVERIASVAQGRYFGAWRGGFIVKRSDYMQPFPIGSLGDGAWRMLAMAIAITQCRGGVLLVDEIDTGLHHTVMADMWRLIFSAAKELDVQVFATTHSHDCVYSLASICSVDADTSTGITIQRIEVGRRKAVPFTEPEIKIAAERQIEIR